jgi:hypothetical protein
MTKNLQQPTSLPNKCSFTLVQNFLGRSGGTKQPGHRIIIAPRIVSKSLYLLVASNMPKFTN